MYLFYFFFGFFRKMAVSLLIDRQHIRMSSGAFLPVAGRFVIVLIGNVSISIRMAYYFPTRLTRLIKFISCGSFLLGTLHPVLPYSRVM